MDEIERDLEALLKQSVAEAAKRRRDRAAPSVASAVSEGYRLAFTDPKNWHLTGQVQLVHRDGNVETLIGLFDEFVHVTSKSTRKLVATKLATDGKPRVEYASDSYMPTQVLAFKRTAADEKVRVIADLTLDMGVFAGTTEVDCTLVGGGVSRVTLVSQTVFHGNTPRTLVDLPAGMDIMEALTRGTKEQIWLEVQSQSGKSLSTGTSNESNEPDEDL